MCVFYFLNIQCNKIQFPSPTLKISFYCIVCFKLIYIFQMLWHAIQIIPKPSRGTMLITLPSQTSQMDHSWKPQNRTVSWPCAFDQTSRILGIPPSQNCRRIPPWEETAEEVNPPLRAEKFHHRGNTEGVIPYDVPHTTSIFFPFMYFIWNEEKKILIWMTI